MLPAPAKKLSKKAERLIAPDWSNLDFSCVCRFFFLSLYY